MWRRLIIAAILARSTQAFAPAPIRWGGISSQRFVIGTSPNRAVVPNEARATPLPLMILRDSGSAPSSEIPRFTANFDNTISWDAQGLCLDANGEKLGAAVRLSPCTGGPRQLWNFVNPGPGRHRQIQLQGTTSCLDVVEKEAAVNGAPIELQECGERVTASWLFEEPIPLPPQHSSDLSASMRHVFLVLTALGTACALALGAGLWWRQHKARAVSLSQHGALLTPDNGGICLASNSDSNEQGLVPAVMMVSPETSKRRSSNISMASSSDGMSWPARGSGQRFIAEADYARCPMGGFTCKTPERFEGARTPGECKGSVRVTFTISDDEPRTVEFLKSQVKDNPSFGAVKVNAPLGLDVGFDPMMSRLVVKAVEAGGHAYKSALRKGDIIRSVSAAEGGPQGGFWPFGAGATVEQGMANLDGKWDQDFWKSVGNQTQPVLLVERPVILGGDDDGGPKSGFGLGKIKSVAEEIKGLLGPAAAPQA